MKNIKIKKQNRFQYRSIVFTMLVVATGGCYPALALVSSNIFGLKLTSCGLTQYELKQLSKIKVFGTIILENVPQLIFQALYAYANEEITSAVAIAFGASLLSVAATTMSYLIDRDADDVKVVQYYIHVEKLQETPQAERKRTETHRFDGDDDDEDEELAIRAKTHIGNDRISAKGGNLDALEDFGSDGLFRMSKDDKQSIITNQGKTQALGSEIAQIYETQTKNIEIGSTMITLRGARTHIVHYVTQLEIESAQKEYNKAGVEVIVTADFLVSQLFELKRNEICKVFCAHFGLKDKYDVEYQDYTSFAMKQVTQRKGDVKDNGLEEENDGSRRLLARMVTHTRLTNGGHTKRNTLTNSFRGSTLGRTTAGQSIEMERMITPGVATDDYKKEEEYNHDLSITQDNTGNNDGEGASLDITGGPGNNNNAVISSNIGRRGGGDVRQSVQDKMATILSDEEADENDAFIDDGRIKENIAMDGPKNNDYSNVDADDDIGLLGDDDNDDMYSNRKTSTPM